jgi:hypothetical protein
VISLPTMSKESLATEIIEMIADKFDRERLDVT